MKSFLSIVLLSSILLSCGGKEESVDEVIKKGDLTSLKAKKSELDLQQSTLKEKINRLSEAIAKRDKKGRATLVTVQTLQDSTFKHYIEVQGNVQTDQNIIVYPEYSGILTEIYVEEGQQVRKGQRLARIDDGGLSSELARQESQTELAKTTYERQKRLWDQNIGSEIAYLEAKSNYEALKASSDQLTSQVAKTEITAPFSGVVDDIISDQGQVVSPGQQSQILRLVNLGNMYVSADVPESFLGKVEKGTEVKVLLASLGETYTGTIRQVGNFVSPDNRTFNVKVSIPNPERKIKPNLIATVMINDYTAEKAISVPARILQQNAAGNSVAYVYEPETDSTGVAKQVTLEQGYSYNDQVEITSGLSNGQSIIVEGARSLRDGQNVAIREENAN